MNIRNFLLLALFCGCFPEGHSQSFEKVLELAKHRYSAYIRAHSDTIRYPRSLRPDGSLAATDAADWTSGFFPGCLWYMYRLTKEEYWKVAADKWTRGLASQQYNTGTHDLGFMLYDSYGNGYQLIKDTAYRAVLLQGAKSLATRFHPQVGAIRSWDNPAFHYPVIIDNLMNLEFLFRAAAISGDSAFYRIAVAHANTDLQYRWRADNSSFHVLDFDPASGRLLRRMTHQGYSDSSCWARGQAWGIYGYTVLYRETKDRRFLQQAIKAADYFLARTDTIADHIPYWDFQDPRIPNAPRDASAAAVAASGLLELSRYAGRVAPGGFAGRVAPSGSAGKIAPGRSAGIVVPGRSAERATPDRSAVRATPDRSAVRAAPDRSAERATPDRSAVRIARSNYAGRFGPSNSAGMRYREKARQMLVSLCSDKYIEDADVPFILRHSTGHMPNHSEVDVPIIYADYYFLEALWRLDHPAW